MVIHLGKYRLTQIKTQNTLSGLILNLGQIVKYMSISPGVLKRKSSSIGVVSSMIKTTKKNAMDT